MERDLIKSILDDYKLQQQKVGKELGETNKRFNRISVRISLYDQLLTQIENDPVHVPPAPASQS